MAHSIRPASLATEGTRITAFLSAHLSLEATTERFDWLYLKNPAGPGKVWVACETETGNIIGVSAAFPRKISRGGSEVRGYVLGDFCIHPDYRSLGPAIALQRKTLEDLSNDRADLIFDFPSSSMLAIYRRLRIEPQYSSIRFAKPLRADRQIRERIPVKAAGTVLAAAANTALRLRDAKLTRSSEWSITEATAPCGEEFTIAFEKWAPQLGALGIRSAEYLNWRFLSHPQRRYQFLTARKGGNLGGYLIYHWAGQDATVVDLFAEEQQVSRALLSEAIAITRGCGVQTLSAPLLGSPGYKKIFEDSGFHPRESSPVVVLELNGNAVHGGTEIEDRLFLMHGDRES